MTQSTKVSNNTGLLFFGRLTKEKGFDIILSILKRFLTEYKKLPFDIYIFGAGEYEKDIIELTKQSKKIHFFGRRNLEEIKRYIPNCEYTLMPSDFLETFGLVALNSISRGLPVIGFKKGGAAQFMLDEHNISKYEGKTNSEKLYNLINYLNKNYNKNKFKRIQDQVKEISGKYTKDQRLENFEKLINTTLTKGGRCNSSNNKILIISDFKTKVGGIETYIHDSKNILEQNGYQVKIYGKKLGKRQNKLYFKWLFMLCATLNFREYFRLKKVIKEYQPDLIWYNSILRYFGHLGVKASKHYKCQKWLMYHDFGYFFPYPSKLYEESEVQIPLSRRGFLKSANTKNILKIFLLRIKYFSISKIRKCSKYIDLHLVPSKYMENIVYKSYKMSKDKVRSFNHFIQS